VPTSMTAAPGLIQPDCTKPAFAHGGDDDISAADGIGQITRLGMANGDGSIGMHEKEGHGLADNVASAEDDGVGAFERDSRCGAEFPCSRRECRRPNRDVPLTRRPRLTGMEAVHVFGGIDGFEDALGVDLRGEGKLDENAVDVVVAIEVFDDGEEIESGHGRWRPEEGRWRGRVARRRRFLLLT